MKNKNRKYLSKQKGFSFSFDALIAVFLFVGILTFVSFSLQGFDLQKPLQKQIAIDLIEAAYDLDKLQQYDQNEIETFITQNLPPQYNYSLEIDSYTLNGSFTLDAQYVFGNTNDLNAYQVEAKKIFLNFDQNDIINFNSAKLGVWVE